MFFLFIIFFVFAEQKLILDVLWLQCFKKLIKMVEDTGATRNLILNLEAKMQAIQERTRALNFERIEKDLADIRAENKALIEKIKAIQV